MDQFVSTYRQSYLWPYVNTLGVKPIGEPKSNILCECHCHLDRGGPSGPNALKDQSWSRDGPMGPLLDPKLYPARVGTSPESDTMRYNQPNVFLQRLQQKYPFIYEILRTAPPDDMISRINRDRLRTTYQVDFCHLNEYPSAPYDQLIRAAQLKGTGPCDNVTRLPGDPYQPGHKFDGSGETEHNNSNLEMGEGGNIAFRPATISKIPRAEGGVTQKKVCPSGIPNATPGFTEYMDTVSKVGQTIIREKLHYRGKT